MSNKVIQWLNGELSKEEASQWQKGFILRLLSSLKRLFIMAGFGALVGLGLSLILPQTYQAELMLAVDNDENSGWESLLGQFGLDIGGLNPGGIFEGESLVQLLGTKYMTDRTLLTEVVINNQKQVLANRLLPHTKWGNKSATKDVVFTTDRQSFTPLQDSVLMLLSRYMRNKVVAASKPDKKQSLIWVKASHQDKHFAKAFVEELVSNTGSYYVESITKKARANLNILKKEADSVETLLYSNMYRSAEAGDVNVNPLHQRLRVDQNRALVDLNVTVALYGEIVKNQKLAEIGLRKQTPLIQVIERPIFPLNRNGLNWWQFMLVGAAFGASTVLWRVLQIKL